MPEYDSTQDTHRHIDQVASNLTDVIDNLRHRALVHDKSKLEEPEKSVFDKYTPKLRDTTYGSPEYAEFLKGMGEGLDHHYAVNDHHPEHHAGNDGIHGMNLLQLIEMLADWYAATKRHADGDLRKSIAQNAQRFGYDHRFELVLVRTAKELGWL